MAMGRTAARREPVRREILSIKGRERTMAYAHCPTRTGRVGRTGHGAQRAVAIGAIGAIAAKCAVAIGAIGVIAAKCALAIGAIGAIAAIAAILSLGALGIGAMVQSAR